MFNSLDSRRRGSNGFVRGLLGLFIGYTGDQGGGQPLQVQGGALISGTITSPQLQGTAFSAHASANQNVTSGVTTKVTLDVEDFDKNNEFASSRFTCTKAGVYGFSAFFMADDTVAVSGTVGYIYKNGTPNRTFYQQNNGGGAGSVVSVEIELAVGDYVELYGLATGTAPYFRWGSASWNCMLCGTFLRTS